MSLPGNEPGRARVLRASLIACVFLECFEPLLNFRCGKFLQIILPKQFLVLHVLKIIS